VCVITLYAGLLTVLALKIAGGDARSTVGRNRANKFLVDRTQIIRYPNSKSGKAHRESDETFETRKAEN